MQRLARLRSATAASLHLSVCSLWVIDSSTGEFRDDFQERAADFATVG